MALVFLVPLIGEAVAGGGDAEGQRGVGGDNVGRGRLCDDGGRHLDFDDGIGAGDGGGEVADDDAVGARIGRVGIEDGGAIGVAADIVGCIQEP